MSDETPGSIQSYINGALRKRLTSEVEKVPVPRFGGRLVLRCQAVDPRTLIRMGLESQEAADPVDGVINAAVDGLLAACVGSETDRGEDLGVPLGSALAATLGLTENMDVPINDREAVFLIFEDEAEIVEAAASLNRFQELAMRDAGNDIVKNSAAAAG